MTGALKVSFGGPDARIDFPDGSSVTFDRPDGDGNVAVKLRGAGATIVRGSLSPAQISALVGTFVPKIGDEDENGR